MEIDYGLILDEVRANQKLLDECPRHHFPTMPDQLLFRSKMHCAKCGGSIDALQAYAYTRGYVAAGGNGNDIIAGWN